MDILDKIPPELALIVWDYLNPVKAYRSIRDNKIGKYYSPVDSDILLKPIRCRVFRYTTKKGAYVCNQDSPIEQCPHCGCGFQGLDDEDDDYCVRQCDCIQRQYIFLEPDEMGYTNTVDVAHCSCTNWIGIAKTDGGVHPEDYLGFIAYWTTVYGIEYYLFAWVKIISAKQIQRWWKRQRNRLKKKGLLRKQIKARNNLVVHSVSYASIVSKRIS